jgi:hypothetical protein
MSTFPAAQDQIYISGVSKWAGILSRILRIFFLANQGHVMCNLSKVIYIYIDWFIVFNATFSNISAISFMATSFSGWSIRWEPPTMVHSLINVYASLSPIQRGFVPGFVNYKKGCTRLAATSDKVYQLLAHGRLRNLVCGFLYYWIIACNTWSMMS